MNVSLTLEEILPLLPDVAVNGGTTVSEIKGISSLDTARAEDLSFLGNSKYKSQVPLTMASVVLLPEGYVGEPKENQLFIRMKEPSRGLAEICRLLEKRIYPAPSSGIHETAYVHPDARIADGPGTGKIDIFSFIQLLISNLPGSEMAGVPASEITETI